MSLENEIKEAFARHEGDVLPQAAAWRDVEGRIGRNHRKRVAAAGLGVALAIAGAVLAVPRLFDREAPPPVTSGWQEFNSTEFGIRFQYPQDWTIAFANANQIGIHPEATAKGPFFNATVGFTPTAYDATLPEAKVTRGTIGGHRYTRSVNRPAGPYGFMGEPRVEYKIEWPTPASACDAQGRCLTHSLTFAMRAGTDGVFSRYESTADRIASTIRLVPVRSGSPHVINKISVPAFRLAIGRFSLWGLVRAQKEGDRAQLVRMDPDGKVTARITVGNHPEDVAADSNSVWVTNGSGCGYENICGDSAHPPTFHFPQQSSVMHIDAATNKVVATIKVFEPQSVALGFDSVWVTTGGATYGSGTQLIRIDPATNKITATIKIGTTREPSNLTVGSDYMWVMNPLPNGDFQIVRVDPRTNKVTRGATVRGASLPAAIASGPEAVWATTAGQDSASGLARLDPVSGRILAQITLPDAAPIGLMAVATGDGYVWATSGRGYLWKVDPSTNKPVGNPLQIGDAPPVTTPDVVVGLGSVWVCSDDGKIWQLSP